MNWDKVPKFDSETYGRIALNDLVTYAVYYLSQTDNEISAEDIVAACFLLFPTRFVLRGYPQWPDSTVVNKRWIDCRNKELIVGSTKDGFSLTPKGQKLAEKVDQQLRGDRPVFSPRSNKVQSELRTRAGHFVRSLESSDAFRLYKQKKENAEISEFDFRGMLLCTLESSATTLRNNFGQFSQYAAFYDREDLLTFLEFCKERFANLLTDGSGVPNHRGGMMRQRTR